MKFLTLAWYALRSVLLRGPAAAIRLLASESAKEKQLNIETREFKSSKSAQYFHYQGAAYQVLEKIFGNLEKKYFAYRFMDIGCGKGRAVFMAERAGFNDLTGIELDQELVATAQDNLERYANKRQESRIKFINVNAVNFEYGNRPTVYFLFNPFNQLVLEKVIRRIQSTGSEESLFIYMNPKYRKPFERNGFKVVKRIKTGLYTEAIFYKSS